jgi:deoxycytidine triphosphate deaminase
MSSAILSPRKAFELGWIYDLADPDKQIQQAGIDIRIEKVFRIQGTAYLSETEKRAPSYIEVFPSGENKEFVLQAGETYLFDAYESVTMPNNATAIVWRRSTLNRFAVDITAGLWDPGFKGKLGGRISPQVRLTIARGTRVAQVFFLSTEAASTYQGQYQNGSSQIVPK